jgi:hypothetical protein
MPLRKAIFVLQQPYKIATTNYQNQLEQQQKMIQALSDRIKAIENQ